MDRSPRHFGFSNAFLSVAPRDSHFVTAFPLFPNPLDKLPMISAMRLWEMVVQHPNPASWRGFRRVFFGKWYAAMRTG